MIVPPYIARALRGWVTWREARQRQRRFARMLRVNPELRVRAEIHHRLQEGHKPSRAALKALRDATTAELRREVQG